MWKPTVNEAVLSRNGCGTRLLILQSRDRSKLAPFLMAHRSSVDEALLEYGGVLLRGFDSTSDGGLANLMTSAVHEPMMYRDRATPRRQVDGPVMSSTEAPPHFRILLHCESSFTNRWPRRLLFQCLKPSPRGGCTPIADVRRVYERIPSQIKRRLEAAGVTYVRHFGKGPGMDYRDVFQVKDEQELERYCEAADIHTARPADDLIRTWQTRPACARHPQTQEWVWFNHACTLHVSLLETSLRDTMRKQYGRYRLPHNTYDGFGGELDDDLIQRIYSAYEAETIRFDWQAGDVLMLDNMLMAHGRDAYEGDREVVVAMGDPLSWKDVQHTDMGQFDSSTFDGESSVLGTPVTGALDERQLEETILSIVRRVLSDETISAESDFFEVGGDSVVAAKVVEELLEQSGIEMPLDIAFDEETIGDWANAIAASSA